MTGTRPRPANHGPMARLPGLRVLAAATPLVLMPWVGACGGDGEAPPADQAPVVGAPGSSPTWDEVASPDSRLFAVEDLAGPEAVKYDPDQDVYFVSSFGPSEDEEANDGFLSRVSAGDGAMESLHWATGPEETPLLQPRGMALVGDSLWVADARGLHAFHRVDGTHLAFVDLTELDPGFLNDIAVGPDGALYVTDTGTSQVLRVGADGATVAAEGETLGSPNGITWVEEWDAFVLVPWAGADTLRRWRPGGTAVEHFAFTPGARFDGVEVVDGALVVASQADSSLHVVAGAEGHPFLKLPGRPADIAIDTRRRRVAVPYISLNRVEVFALPEGAPGGG